MSIRADAARRENAPTLPSNRSFGFLFVVVFALLAAWTWWHASRWAPWWLAASVLIAAVAVAVPRLLTPFNVAWMKLAEVLHGIVSPVVLGLLFYGVVTPFGWGRRWLGGDPLARRFEAGRDSYWIDRRPPGPPPDSFPNQF